MRRFRLLAVCLLPLLLAGCSVVSIQVEDHPPEKEPYRETETTQTDPGSTPFAIVIPDEYKDFLIVTTEFPDADPNDHTVPLLTVQEKASVEALMQDFGSSEGGGFLFGIVQMDQVDLENHLLNDYGGIHVFARDDTHYYAMTYPTDVQFYRSGTASDDDWAQWTELSGLSTYVCQAFTEDNALQPYSTGEFWARDFTYEGEHVYLRFHPYPGCDGSVAERYTLVLSQPVQQGEGGIWCVERWYDEFGALYLNFPGGNTPSAEVYAAAQDACNRGERTELLTPVGAAREFLSASGRFHLPAADEAITAADGPDTEYTAANDLMRLTMYPLLSGYHPPSEEDILALLNGFLPETWGVMGRHLYGSDWWSPLQSALEQVAVGGDQTARNESMMHFYLTAYGPYADFIGGVLQQQQDADPAAFAAAMEAFTEQEQSLLQSAAD